MPEEAEAGHIRHGAHAFHRAETGARRVEARRRGDHFFVAAFIEYFALQRR